MKNKFKNIFEEMASFFFLGTLFCICLIVSNILAFKLISCGPFTATAGMFIIPVSYIIGDTITEVWGFKKARQVIFAGFAMNLLTAVFIWLAIRLPSAPFWEHQEAFEMVLGSTPRITIASMLAFLSGSFLNALIMDAMKTVQKGRNFPLRAIISTVAGELADSSLFFILAFAFTISFKEILSMALFQTLIKIVFEIMILPFTKILVRKLQGCYGNVS